MLNALRHQRFGHKLPTKPPRLSQCAQRLTASEVWAPGNHARHARQPLQVLNALRHQRFGHGRRMNRQGVGPKLCSTPYGIRGLGTPAPPRALTKSCSAQRLTASEVWAHHAPIPYNQATEGCSTPYGIRGLGTHQRVRSCHPPQVLNALRHQRFGHRVGIQCEVLTGKSAQRLTASEVWAPIGFNAAPIVPWVLNALRHQRFGHPGAYPFPASPASCSTPYGIRGLGTLTFKRFSQQNT